MRVVFFACVCVSGRSRGAACRVFCAATEYVVRDRGAPELFFLLVLHTFMLPSCTIQCRAPQRPAMRRGTTRRELAAPSTDVTPPHHAPTKAARAHHGNVANSTTQWSRLNARPYRERERHAPQFRDQRQVQGALRGAHGTERAHVRCATWTPWPLSLASCSRASQRQWRPL